MTDSLFLSIWFPTFRESEIVPKALSVLRQFPYSAVREGVTYLSVHPVAWSEPTVLERRFNPGVSPEESAEIAQEFAHSDYALVFEAFWDLWVPNEDEHGEAWVQRPSPVKFVAHGVEFEEGTYTEDGHIQVDFGLDTLFLFEGMRLTADIEMRIRTNVAKLVAFSIAVERHCGVSGRVLWSESEDNLAQKLIATLQQTH